MAGRRKEDPVVPGKWAKVASFRVCFGREENAGSGRFVFI
jgi:hypothetical protein